MNTVFCEETFTITNDLLPELKEKLVLYLYEVVTNIDFKMKHKPGFIFNNLYFENTFYIRYFIENLCIKDILQNHNFKTQIEFKKYILALFEQNILNNKERFESAMIMVSFIITMYFIDHGLILDLMYDFPGNLIDFFLYNKAPKLLVLKTNIISFSFFFSIDVIIHHPEVLSIPMVFLNFFKDIFIPILPDYFINKAIIQKGTMGAVLEFFKNTYKFW